MFDATEFWLLFAVAFAGLNLLPPHSIQMRASLLAILGVFALSFVYSMNLPAIVAVIIGIGLLFVIARHIAAKASEYGLRHILLAISPILAIWMIAKTAVAFEDARLMPLMIVGFSYILVKIWTLLKDILDQKVTDISLPVIFAYLLYFPAYLSGPMHYYGEFKSTLETPDPLDGQIVLDSLFRFMVGLMKVQVLATLLVPASLLSLPDDTSIPLLTLIGAAFVYSFVLYFDFSGYSDMVVAASRLLGIRVPENFNKPYFAQTIGDFWRRWHISFSRALTAHVFIPVVKLLNSVGVKNPLWVSFFGYAATFGFAGYWHGPTSNFVLWGLYHAVGLFVQDRWTKSRRKPGPPVKLPWYAPSKLIAIFVTFTFVSMGWILFVLPVSRLSLVGLS